MVIYQANDFSSEQVPPGNNVASVYKLRVEGAGQNGGAIIFENETMLEFSRQFLSISISTNKAIYDGTQVRIH